LLQVVPKIQFQLYFRNLKHFSIASKSIEAEFRQQSELSLIRKSFRSLKQYAMRYETRELKVRQVIQISQRLSI